MPLAGSGGTFTQVGTYTQVGQVRAFAQVRLGKGESVFQQVAQQARHVLKGPGADSSGLGR